MIALIIISLVLREYYPLSRFPMYSHFDSKSHYLFMTDEHGVAVTDMRHQFMQTAIRMHKMHSTKVDKIRNQPGNRQRDRLELMREAGPPILEQMLEFQKQRWSKRKDHSDKRIFQRLDLWVVFLHFENGEGDAGPGIRRERYHLATWPPDAAGEEPPTVIEIPTGEDLP